MAERWRRIEPAAFDTRLCVTPGCPNELDASDLLDASREDVEKCGPCRRGEGLAARLKAAAAAAPDSGSNATQRAAQTARAARTGQPTGEPLTESEQRVLALLMEGLTAAAAAEQLHLSTLTVRHHAKRVLAKLDARNTAHAVAVAFRHGLAT